jgi:hypothetical protein
VRTRFEFDFDTKATPNQVIELMTDFSPNRRAAPRHAAHRDLTCERHQLGRDGAEDLFLICRDPRWHLGKDSRPVEEPVAGASSYEPGASGDAVVDYGVNLVASGLVDERSYATSPSAGLPILSCSARSVRSAVYSSTSGAAKRWRLAAMQTWPALWNDPKLPTRAACSRSAFSSTTSAELPPSSRRNRLRSGAASRPPRVRLPPTRERDYGNVGMGDEFSSDIATTRKHM